MDPDDKTSSINLSWEAETTNLKEKKKKRNKGLISVLVKGLEKEALIQQEDVLQSVTRIYPFNQKV